MVFSLLEVGDALEEGAGFPGIPWKAEGLRWLVTLLQGFFSNFPWVLAERRAFFIWSESGESGVGEQL